MRLEFNNRQGIWADLLRSDTERVFIATDEDARIGSTVTVTVTARDLKEAVTIEGLVLAKRPKSERFEAGVFVKFGEREIQRCREAVGLEPTPRAARVEARHELRSDCVLTAQFLVPALPAPCQVRNLSLSGLLANCPADFSVGQGVEVRIELAAGVEVSVHAAVSWARNELHLVGLTFKPETPAQVIDTIARTIEAMHSASAPAPNPAPQGRPQVVIADDDPDILMFLTKALKALGHVAATASRGDDALQAIRTLHPRIAFLDVLMPGMDGLDVCKALRSDAAFTSMPIVLLSAIEAGRLHDMAASAGATDYLSKPLALADLRALVTKYLA